MDFSSPVNVALFNNMNHVNVESPSKGVMCEICKISLSSMVKLKFVYCYYFFLLKFNDNFFNFVRLF